MIPTETSVPLPEPAPRSSGPLILFVLLGLVMTVGLLVYHLILWSMQQTAMISGSQAQLEWAGFIGLAVQGVVLTGLIAILWRFSTDPRVRPIYAGWLVASLVAFPGLLLRLLGPNNDQLGSILQILICVIAAFILVHLVMVVASGFRKQMRAMTFPERVTR